MKKAIIFFLTLFIITSCNFFSSVDNSIQTKDVDFNEQNIIGTWKMDKFSYKYLSSDKKTDSIYIFFHKNGEFIVNNSKDLFNTSPHINTKNGIIDYKISNGKWYIKQYKYREKIYKTLELTYEDNTKQIDLKVYKKADEYQIWYFFGDPDNGYRLRFLKIK